MLKKKIFSKHLNLGQLKTRFIWIPDNLGSGICRPERYTDNSHNNLKTGLVFRGLFSNFLGAILNAICIPLQYSYHDMNSEHSKIGHVQAILKLDLSGIQTVVSIRILSHVSNFLVKIRACSKKSGKHESRIVKADYGCVNIVSYTKVFISLTL